MALYVAQPAALRPELRQPRYPARAAHLLEDHAEGELIGGGRWRLFEGQGTACVYEWNVHTARGWMNRLAPVARPLFAWNHDIVMRQGAQGLSQLLNAPLLART